MSPKFPSPHFSSPLLSPSLCLLLLLSSPFTFSMHLTSPLLSFHLHYTPHLSSPLFSFPQLSSIHFALSLSSPLLRDPWWSQQAAKPTQPPRIILHKLSQAGFSLFLSLSVFCLAFSLSQPLSHSKPPRLFLCNGLRASLAVFSIPDRKSVV